MNTYLQSLCQRSWLKYSILGCIVIVIVSTICYRHIKHHQAVKARENFEKVLANYELHLVKAIDVCFASAELCRAERDVPFSDPLCAEAFHVVRLYKLESRMRAAIPFTTFAEGGHAEAVKELNYITELRIKAEEKVEE